MKIKKICFIIFIFAVVILLNNKCFAKDLDRINKYYITVDPRRDGSLNMSYHVEWEVLDSKKEGPLEWVKIGIPNSHVDNIKSNSKEIQSIKYYQDEGSYIRIDFKNQYQKGEVVSFDFSFHQKFMYEIEDDFCIFSFTPGWFYDIEVKDIQVFWNAENVTSSTADKTNSDNYLVWKGKLKKGKKLKTSVTYPISAFSELKTKEEIEDMYNINSLLSSIGVDSENLSDLETSNLNMSNLDLSILESLNINTSNFSYLFNNMGKLFGLAVGLIMLGSILSIFSGFGYSRHGGYAYDDDDYYYSRKNRRSTSRSSRSCVTSCACACACAGGGRAGCSKKDFYGTNLRTKNIKKVLDK